MSPDDWFSGLSCSFMISKTLKFFCSECAIDCSNKICHVIYLVHHFYAAFHYP